MKYGDYGLTYMAPGRYRITHHGYRTGWELERHGKGWNICRATDVPKSEYVTQKIALRAFHQLHNRPKDRSET